MYIYLSKGKLIWGVFFPSNSSLHIYIFYSREDETEGQMFVYLYMSVNVFPSIFPSKAESCNLTVYQSVWPCITLHLYNHTYLERKATTSLRVSLTVWGQSSQERSNIYNYLPSFPSKRVWMCVSTSMFPRRTLNPVNLTFLFLVLVPGGSAGDSTFPTLLLDPSDSSSPQP